jgi:hypothetical protein
MINFPINDLDLSPYVDKPDSKTCYLYDLFGIVNHYGTMNRGHYMSTVRNERTGEWIQYDDSSCKLLTKLSEVHTSNAYILFYRRKDLDKKPLKHIIPTLNLTRFPGLPIHIKPGYLTKKQLVCYLIEYREGHPCPYKLGLQNGTILYLSSQAIVRDPDTEELNHLTPKKKNKT